MIWSDWTFVVGGGETVLSFPGTCDVERPDDATVFLGPCRFHSRDHGEPGLGGGPRRDRGAKAPRSADHSAGSEADLRPALGRGDLSVLPDFGVSRRDGPLASYRRSPAGRAQGSA